MTADTCLTIILYSKKSCFAIFFSTIFWLLPPAFADETSNTTITINSTNAAPNIITINNNVINEQKKKTKDRDVHLSFSGYYVIPDKVSPDNNVLLNSQALAMQLSSSINSFQVGFEYVGVINSSHSYQYSVPYGKRTEQRNYNIHSANIFGRISPWHLAYVTPYFGGFLGASWVIDTTNNSDVFDKKVSEDKFINTGLIAGFELLPNSMISIFVETRKSFQLKSSLQRSTIIYTDQFGQKETKTDTIKFDALYLGAGLRFNF